MRRTSFERRSKRQLSEQLFFVQSNKESDPKQCVEREKEDNRRGVRVGSL